VLSLENNRRRRPAVVSVPPVGCSYCGHSSCGGGGGWPEGRDGTNRRARVEGVAGAPRQGRGDFEKKMRLGRLVAGGLL
jgi:hypothetical protein